MDPRSEAILADHVHPDLVKVMRAAAQAPQPFIVDYGLRTLAAEQQAVATGHSETMHSRHLPDAHYGGDAMAVDVAALIGGQVSFAPGHELAVFGQIAVQVKAAAAAAGVKLQWGGDPVGAWIDGVVSHFRDWGHFQLDPSAYP
jgi:peptidoglycan LD-endopeptidase CwlK